MLALTDLAPMHAGAHLLMDCIVAFVAMAHFKKGHPAACEFANRIGCLCEDRFREDGWSGGEVENTSHYAMPSNEKSVAPCGATHHCVSVTLLKKYTAFAYNA